MVTIDIKNIANKINIYKRHLESESKRAVLYGKVLDKNGIKRPEVE